MSHRIQELTIESKLTRGSRGVQFLLYLLEVPSASLNFLYLLEVPSASLRVLRSSKPFKDFSRAQSLRLRLFKSVLLVQNPNLPLRRKAQEVWTVDRVRLGVFEMSVCVIEPALIAKQLRQVVMNPK